MIHRCLFPLTQWRLNETGMLEGLVDVRDRCATGAVNRHSRINTPQIRELFIYEFQLETWNMNQAYNLPEI